MNFFGVAPSLQKDKTSKDVSPMDALKVSLSCTAWVKWEIQSAASTSFSSSSDARNFTFCDVHIFSANSQTSPSHLGNSSEHQRASEDVLRTSPDIFWDVSWQFGPERMCWYEDKGARPEGSGCSVWTSAGAHGSRTQAKLGINMDVHQAPCPLPPCLSLCAATVRCVPVNSINSMAATSSHAKVINKHPQMAHNDSLQSDAAVWRVSTRVVAAHSSVCLAVYRHSPTSRTQQRTN